MLLRLILLELYEERRSHLPIAEETIPSISQIIGLLYSCLCHLLQDMAASPLVVQAVALTVVHLSKFSHSNQFCPSDHPPHSFTQDKAKVIHFLFTQVSEVEPNRADLMIRKRLLGKLLRDLWHDLWRNYLSHGIGPA